MILKRQGSSNSTASDNEATRYEDGADGDLAVGCEALEGGESETMVEVR